MSYLKKNNVDQRDDQIYDGFLALSIFNVTSLCNIQYDTERFLYMSGIFCLEQNSTIS